MTKKKLSLGSLLLLSAVLISCDGGRGRIARPGNALVQPAIRYATVSPQRSYSQDRATSNISKRGLCLSRGLAFANSRASLSFRNEIYYFSSLEHSHQAPVDWRLMAALAYVESGGDPYVEGGVFGIGNDVCDDAELKALGLDPEKKENSVLWAICSGPRYYQGLYRAMMAPTREGLYQPTLEDGRRLAVAAYRLGFDYVRGVQTGSEEPRSWVSVCQNLPDEDIYEVLKVMGQYEYFKSEDLFLGSVTRIIPEEVEDPEGDVEEGKETPGDSEGEEDSSDEGETGETPPSVEEPSLDDRPYTDPGDSPQDFDIVIPKNADQAVSDEPGKRVVDVIAEEASEARNVGTGLQPGENDATLAEGLDWRLVLAIAWQQSLLDLKGFEPKSEASGIMQITPGSAKVLGIDWSEIFNLRKNVRGGVQHYRWLLSLLYAPENEDDLSRQKRNFSYIRKGEKAFYPIWTSEEKGDRFRLAFSAYLAGPAHLSDAQSVAEKEGLDPRLWNSLKETFPKLQNETYLKENPETCRFGYCKGRSVVRDVESLFEVKYPALLKAYPIAGYEEMSDAVRQEVQEELK